MDIGNFMWFNLVLSLAESCTGIFWWNKTPTQCGFQEVVRSLAGLSVVPSGPLTETLPHAKKPMALLSFPGYQERTKR